LFEMFLEQKAGVIGADGNSHGQRLYYEVPTFLEPGT